MNPLLTRLSQLVVAALVLAMAIAVYAVQIEPDWVRILPVTLELPHLDPEFQGYRIVQISDIHLAER
jgi:hypothetical protein